MEHTARKINDQRVEIYIERMSESWRKQLPSPPPFKPGTIVVSCTYFAATYRVERWTGEKWEYVGTAYRTHANTYAMETHQRMHLDAVIGAYLQEEARKK